MSVWVCVVYDAYLFCITEKSKCGHVVGVPTTTSFLDFFLALQESRQPQICHNYQSKILIDYNSSRCSEICYNCRLQTLIDLSPWSSENLGSPRSEIIFDQKLSPIFLYLAVQEFWRRFEI